MKGKQNWTLALIAVLTFGAGEVVGQTEGRELGPRGGIDAAIVISMRDRLELDDEQIGHLDAWRGEQVARRNEERAGMQEMRSQLRAGQIERSEVMAYMEQRRDVVRASGEQSRVRLEGILNVSQLQAYDSVVRERRAFAKGRASAMRGTRGGVRGGRMGIRGDRSRLRVVHHRVRGRLGRRGDGPGFRGGRGWSRQDVRFRRGPRGEDLRPGQGLQPEMELGPEGDTVLDPHGVLEPT